MSLVQKCKINKGSGVKFWLTWRNYGSFLNYFSCKMIGSIRKFPNSDDKTLLQYMIYFSHMHQAPGRSIVFCSAYFGGSVQCQQTACSARFNVLHPLFRDKLPRIAPSTLWRNHKIYSKYLMNFWHCCLFISIFLKFKIKMFWVG